MGRVSKKLDAKAMSTPFVKMKLVSTDRKRERLPIDSDAVGKVSMNDLLKKHVRYADPILTAMSQSLPYIASLPPKQRKKLGIASSVAMQNAHLDRYKRLEDLRESAQYASPPIRPIAPPPPPQPTAVLPQAITQSTNDDGEYADGMALQVASIPRKYGEKFHQVLTYLENTASSAVGKSHSGELMLHGRALRGTNYESAFRDLYINTNVPAPGARELLMHLKRLGVPKSAFTSKFAHAVYEQNRVGRRTSVLRVY
jgi:hypothetical protein